MATQNTNILLKSWITKHITIIQSKVYEQNSYVHYISYTLTFKYFSYYKWVLPSPFPLHPSHTSLSISAVAKKMWPKVFTVFLVLHSFFLLHGVAQTGPPRPNPTITRIRPRPPLIPPGTKLKPRQPINNPGPLANRARILYITQELKRNITYDPKGYTKTWVGNNYCLFKGFFCDVVPDLNITGLSSIDFSGARFGGPFLNFYRFIRNLPDIALFHANSNNFTGVINRNINKLRYLYELDLSNNKFLGGFPGYILGANKLSFVDFRFNTYNGSVPYRLFNIDTDVLFINNNGFTGRIPQATFGNTPALYITLAGNNFTGTTFLYNVITYIIYLFFYWSLNQFKSLKVLVFSPINSVGLRLK